METNKSNKKDWTDNGICTTLINPWWKTTYCACVCVRVSTLITSCLLYGIIFEFHEGLVEGLIAVDYRLQLCSDRDCLLAGVIFDILDLHFSVSERHFYRVLWSEKAAAVGFCKFFLTSLHWYICPVGNLKDVGHNFWFVTGFSALIKYLSTY